MESMIDAAVHMGFPREVATKLVLTTLRGSSSYALQAGSSVHTLKSNVSNIYFSIMLAYFFALKSIDSLC